MRAHADLWKKAWVEARRLRVRRVDVIDSQTKLLDPGVRWFVLALESMGARTRHSCDGRGRLCDWYVTCEAPYDVAEVVAMLDVRMDVRLCAIPVTGEDSFWELRFARWHFLEADSPNGTSDEELGSADPQLFCRRMQEWTVRNWKRNLASVLRTLRARKVLEGRG